MIIMQYLIYFYRPVIQQAAIVMDLKVHRGVSGHREVRAVKVRFDNFIFAIKIHYNTID